jgi:superfamily II DNA or RNA helicase
MNKVYVQPYSQAYIILTASDDGIEQELSDHFSFQVNNYKFMPAYKAGRWDGYIRLFDRRTKLIYAGLVHEIEKFCEKHNYDLEMDHSMFAENEISEKEALEHVKYLDLPFEPRDYQMEAFIDAIRKKRRTIISPTGSGKSLIAYLIATYLNLKTLIIVPRTDLVHQLSNDFKDYGYQDDMHLIYSGKDKESDCLFNFTTWQSVYKMPKKWFEQFDCVIVDETHGAKSQSITRILTNLSECEYRYGLTGTLDGQEINKLVIEGLLGPVRYAAKTHELIENEHLAAFKIKCIVLHYSDEIKQKLYNSPYQDEIDFLIGYEPRNNFLRNLALSLKGNTVTLCRYVEKHGDILHDKISKANDEETYYFYGGVDAEVRSSWRKAIEENDNAQIIATIGSFAVGTNIKSLKNIIFASPSKARINTLQAIGRVLRLHEGKDTAVLYDIADNLEWNKKRNYTINHFVERLKIYKQEKLPFKIYNVRIK